MNKHIEQITTVVSWKYKLSLIITSCLAMCLIIIIITMLLFINRSTSSSSESLLTLSAGETEPLSVFKDILHISLNQPTNSSEMMKKFMHSIYDEMHLEKRRKRHLYLPKSSLILSDHIDSIVSLFNQNNESTYSFEYQSSLENLTHLELVLPIRRLTKFSTIQIESNRFNLLFQQPFKLEKNFFKINLTNYIQTFPVQFSIKLHQISLHSSGFLTLYFQRSSASHSRFRRDSDDENQLITYPNDPSSCQVRPFRATFAELNWTSWIVEPSSYEMNICSGLCHTNSHLPSYFTMQNILHQRSSKQIPELCCKPKRFASTILLYYDGSNLILKRHENMRVIECSCS